MSYDTPHSLLERLAKHPRDEAAWQRLVDLYQPFLRRWCGRLPELSDADTADITQNVLKVLVEKLPGFVDTRDPGKFRAWLKAILRNCVHEHRRSGMSVATAEALDALQDSTSDLSRGFDAEHNAFLAARLLELAKRQFSAQIYGMFRAVAFDGQPDAAVAKQYGVSINAVYLAKSRVLKWLRDESRGLVDDAAC